MTKTNPQSLLVPRMNSDLEKALQSYISRERVIKQAEIARRLLELIGEARSTRATVDFQPRGTILISALENGDGRRITDRLAAR
jgi:hypothetical protein